MRRQERPAAAACAVMATASVDLPVPSAPDTTIGSVAALRSAAACAGSSVITGARFPRWIPTFSLTPAHPAYKPVAEVLHTRHKRPMRILQSLHVLWWSKDRFPPEFWIYGKRSSGRVNKVAAQG